MVLIRMYLLQLPNDYSGTVLSMTSPSARSFAFLLAPLSAAIAPMLWLRCLRACASFSPMISMLECGRVPSSEPSRSANLISLLGGNGSSCRTLEDGVNSEPLRWKTGVPAPLESLLSRLSRSGKSPHLPRYASYISSESLFNFTMQTSTTPVTILPD